MNYTYKFLDTVAYGSQATISSMNEFLVWILENEERIPTEPKFNLDRYTNYIYNKGTIGTVKALASNAVCEVIKIKLEHEYQNRSILSKGFVNTSTIPSRLYINNLALLIEKKGLSFEEPTISSCLKVLLEYGFCEESKFEYTNFNLEKIPPIDCFISAIKYKWIPRKLSLDLNTFKVCLKAGNPIIMGVSMFNSNSCSNCLFIKPTLGDKYLGNDVILITGYDDIKQRFLMLNCLGEQWGKFGRGYIMYDYALDGSYCGDVYTLI